MNKLMFPRVLYWTPLLQVVVFILGTISSFTTAILNGNVNFYLPFISETGAFVPEMGIFSFTLIIGSFIGIAMILYRYVLVKFSLALETGLLQRLNTIAVYIGVLAMIGLAGVAAFPMTTVFWAHLLSAGVYFSSMMLYIVCVTFFGYKKEGYSAKIKLRIGLCICIVILLVILIICFPIALKNWHELNTTIPALKEPQNDGFTMILISSIMEWGIMGVVLAYTLTFLYEFKEYNQTALFITLDMKEDVLPENNPNAPSALEEAVPVN